MGTSRSISRRHWLWLSGLVVLGGGAAGACGSPTAAPVPDRERIRTDVDPLRHPFRAIGTLSDPHWLGYNPNDSGREFLPDQDPQIRVVGVARLPAGVVASIVGAPGYGFERSAPSETPAALTEFVSANAEWTSSPRYDAHITKSLYRGRFHLSSLTDQVYFDTVNPESVDGPHPQ
ncbi:hypothetical protein ABZY68_15925 [Streptomyces sp. NPDC006482]|uniref:hypothetical protein n=1 Tax=Streptomyces sp. NPDC006482 TaxID=3154306 RepID=UPI0033A76F12